MGTMYHEASMKKHVYNNGINNTSVSAQKQHYRWAIDIQETPQSGTNKYRKLALLKSEIFIAPSINQNNDGTKNTNLACKSGRRIICVVE